MEADDENNSNQDLDSMEDLDDGCAPDSEDGRHGGRFG